MTLNGWMAHPRHIFGVTAKQKMLLLLTPNRQYVLSTAAKMSSWHPALAISYRSRSFSFEACSASNLWTTDVVAASGVVALYILRMGGMENAVLCTVNER